MSESLKFDDRAAPQLERLYSSADVLRRRRLVVQALDAVSGEQLLDVGSGPGLYLAELAETVGRRGQVTGVDSSKVMLAAAARRTAGLANVTLLAGEATDLPVPDESFDAALSVQVYEYVTDIRAALAEMSRVLRPGGRLVVWDIDWSTVSWFSDDAARMGKVLRVWDEHLAHATLPQWLASEMTDAGFVNIQVEGHAFVNTDAGPDAYSGGVIPLVADFVAEHGVPAEEAAEWRLELEALSNASRYFFSVIQFCFSATKPD